jgi:hypothetical protein
VGLNTIMLVLAYFVPRKAVYQALATTQSQFYDWLDYPNL